jgi:Ring finger domain
MDNSRSDGDPTSGGVATIPDSSSIASSRMSAMVAAAQSPQPLSAAYAGRSPAETHGYLMGRNMVGRNMVLQMMIDHNPRHCVTQRGPIAAMPPPVGNPKQDDAIPKIRKRKASPASSPSKKAKLKEPPAGLKTDPEEEQRKETEGDSGGDNSCCICMCEPEPMEASTIDGCAHKFCFSCIDKWSDRENTCPLCKERFANITRVTKHPRGARGEDGEKPKNSKKVKNRDQRADLNPGGNPLEALLGEWSFVIIVGSSRVQKGMLTL